MIAFSLKITINILSVFGLDIHIYQVEPVEVLAVSDGEVVVNLFVVFGDVATGVVVVGSNEQKIIPGHYIYKHERKRKMVSKYKKGD